MKTIDKKKPVMVTGATGYVAGWLVKELLEAGYLVHAPVRDPENQEKLKYLNELATKYKGDIKFFKADLLSEGSYDQAIKTCELVFHTASPFKSAVKDPQKDLVDPALLGTRNVLNSVNRAKSVKRVVLTSSCAAIIGDSKDCLNYPNGVATEEQWNETSTLDHQAYSYSKTLAEKEAWKLNKAQERWDLVVINPSLVMGPGINPNGTSESFNIIKMLADGRLKMGAPELNIGVIDVRDLGKAHFKASFKPSASGRYIISAEHSSFLNLAQILREKYGDQYPFPKKTLPKWLVWLTAPMSGLKRKMVSRNIGYDWLVDNSKGKKELDMEYIPLEKTIIDFFEQMRENGNIN